MKPMSPRDRRWADDDGRTVVDMSEVGRPSLLLPRLGSGKKAETPEPSPRKERIGARQRGAIKHGALRAVRRM